MNKIKTLCANLFLTLVAALFLFIILEVCARIYVVNFAGEQGFKKYASLKQILSKDSNIKFSPHPYLRYIPTPNYMKGKNKHNSLGYRGDEIQMPKPAGQFRIVCIGASTTYDTDIDDYRMSYPFLLEKKLKEKGYKNVNVINAGAGGWTSWESLIDVELRVLDLEPDMLIIYDAINDIHARLVWPPEAYKGDNTGELSTTSYFMMPSIFEYSTLFRIIMINFGITDSQGSVARFGKNIDESKNTYHFVSFLNQKKSNTYPQGIFKEVSAMQMLKINKPIYFMRNIGNIITIAKENHIKTVIASFAYSPLFKDNPQASSEEYIYAFDEMNRVLRNVADERGVNFFDFAKVFPNDKRYYFDGIHNTAEGVQLKVELFASYLIENNLIPAR
jgi:lysophospholipase L1-like esterase